MTIQATPTPVTPGPGRTTTPRRTATVEIVIPVFNEEADLATSVHRLHRYLVESFDYEFTITIADNASTDDTWPLAEVLARGLEHVRAIHLDEKGRGRALKTAWSASDADICVYMDVDLSTDLAALLPLVAPLVSGHSDLAIGTRLTHASRVIRGPKREVISRAYNLLLRGTLGVRFSDAQCGFKAIRRDAARRLLPLVEDPAWFFDTELLVLAERAGLRIHEVPVDWHDDPRSSVKIVATAVADLKGIARLARGLPGQAVRFGVIGVASTAAYFAIYLGLRGLLAAQAANLIALVATAIANTAANRRITFGVRGAAGAGRHHAGGLLAFAVGLGLTSCSLAVLHAVTAQPSRAAEVIVLVTANALATLVRFLALRRLIGGAR